MKKILLLLLFSAPIIFAQKKIEMSDLYSPYVLKEKREQFDLEMKGKIDTWLESKSSVKDEWIWYSGLDALLFTYKRSPKIFSQLRDGIKNFEQNSFKINYLLIECANALYPNDLYDELYKSFNSTENLKLSSAIAHYLLNSNKKKIKNNVIDSIYTEKFLKQKSNPIYNSVKYEIKNFENETRPDIKQLLTHKFQDGATLVFSLQRKNRSFPGITILRKPNGDFVRNSDSSLFAIPHLCRSLSNLPSYLRNGNTPQGIYSLVGYYISPTETIGPSPNFLLRSPREVSTSVFYHNMQTSAKWKVDDYKSLLPKDWQDYFPIYGSWRAGKLGRKLIVSHGTTDDISYYKNEIFYPFSPTKGCMSAIEIWNERGKLVRSDQLKIMNKFFELPNLKGFFIVVEIDNQEKPVDVNEIEQILNSP